MDETPLTQTAAWLSPWMTARRRAEKAVKILLRVVAVSIPTGGRGLNPALRGSKDSL
jgi:hypothetical protein